MDNLHTLLITFFIFLVAFTGSSAHGDRLSVTLWLSGSNADTVPPSFGKTADRHLTQSTETLHKLLKNACQDENTVLSPTLFIHMDSFPGIRNETDLANRCYEALDEINRFEQLLESAWKSFQQAEETADDSGAFQQLSLNASQTYHTVKAQLRLSQSLAKVMVARKMAQLGNKSYSMQAMESAIDSLRTAACSAELSSRSLSGKPTLTSEFLLALRSQFLNEWERAQKTDSLEPIRIFSLKTAVEKALLIQPDATARESLKWLR